MNPIEILIKEQNLNGEEEWESSLYLDLSSLVSEAKAQNPKLCSYGLLTLKNKHAADSMPIKAIVRQNEGEHSIMVVKLKEESSPNKNPESVKQANFNAQNLAQMHQQTANLNQKMMQMNLENQQFDFKNQTTMNSLVEKAEHHNRGESQQFMNHFNKGGYTDERLLEECSRNIFWPYFLTEQNYQKKVKNNIIDFKRSKLKTTNIKNYLQKVISFFSEEQASRFQNILAENSKSFGASTGVSASFCGFGASVNAAYANASEDKKKQTLNEKSYYSKAFSYYIAINPTYAFQIEDKNICFNQNIMSHVKKLYTLFEKNYDQLEEEIFQFFLYYGTHITTGKYSFGAIYEFKNEINFQKQARLEDLERACAKSSNTAISGEAGYGPVSVKGAYSNNSQSNNQSKNVNHSDEFSYTSTTEYKLHGIEIKDREKWREVSGNYRDGWECINCQNVRLLAVTNILKNQQNQLLIPGYKTTFQQLIRVMEEFLEGGFFKYEHQINKKDYILEEEQTDLFYEHPFKFVAKGTNTLEEIWLQYFQGYEVTTVKVSGDSVFQKEQCRPWPYDFGNSYPISCKDFKIDSIETLPSQNQMQFFKVKFQASQPMTIQLTLQFLKKRIIPENLLEQVFAGERKCKIVSLLNPAHALTRFQMLSRLGIKQFTGENKQIFRIVRAEKSCYRIVCQEEDLCLFSDTFPQLTFKKKSDDSKEMFWFTPAKNSAWIIQTVTHQRLGIMSGVEGCAILQQHSDSNKGFEQSQHWRIVPLKRIVQKKKKIN